MNTHSPILIVTSHPLSEVEYIVDELDNRKISYKIIDPAAEELKISVFGGKSAEISMSDGSSFRIDPGSSIFLWKFKQPSSPYLKTLPQAFQQFSRSSLRAAWESLLSIDANWINRDASVKMIANNKCMQENVARTIGIRPICTTFTNDTDNFVNAVEQIEGDIAIKSPISWHYWPNSFENPFGTYTKKLSRKEALHCAPYVKYAPVLVQPYVNKKYELRVTVVGSRVFACRIESQNSPRTRTDWRHYDFKNVPHLADKLSVDLESKLIDLTKHLGLVYSAIDLIVDENEMIHFVELNPTGHYGWIEKLTGLKITEAIVDTLLTGAN